MPNHANGVAAPTTIDVAAPEGWTQMPRPGGGLRLSPTGLGDGPLCPAFTAAARREPQTVLLAELRRTHVSAVSEGLTNVRVLDCGVCAVGDWDAHRVLLSHSVEGVDVTLEQWAIPLRRQTATLTVQAPTLAYAALHPAFQDLVESVDLGA